MANDDVRLTPPERCEYEFYGIRCGLLSGHRGDHSSIIPVNAPWSPRASQISGTQATAIDDLLTAFQRACEMVVVEGDSNISRTTKARAILRNELRARLLAAERGATT